MKTSVNITLTLSVIGGPLKLPKAEIINARVMLKSVKIWGKFPNGVGGDIKRKETSSNFN